MVRTGRLGAVRRTASRRAVAGPGGPGGAEVLAGGGLRVAACQSGHPVPGRVLRPGQMVCRDARFAPGDRSGRGRLDAGGAAECGGVVGGTGYLAAGWDGPFGDGPADAA